MVFFTFMNFLESNNFSSGRVPLRQFLMTVGLLLFFWLSEEGNYCNLSRMVHELK